MGGGREAAYTNYAPPVTITVQSLKGLGDGSQFKEMTTGMCSCLAEDM